jgi:voltage-gated potassium channel Kch
MQGNTNGGVNITSGDYVEIAEPQFELGKVATPFEHRSYGEELALCQRYYQRWDGTGANQMVSTGVMYASTAAITFLDFKTTMRTVPTAFASSTPIEVVVGGAVLAGTGVSFANATPWGVEAQVTVSGGTVGHGAVARLESGGYLAVDAEL